MPSFKENFERDQRDELDYDDSAFYYFSMAILFIVLMPATWYMVLKPVITGGNSINTSLKNCKCHICIVRMKERQAAYSASWLTPWWVIRFTILSMMWGLCYLCYDAVKDIEPLKTFIPNEILGVDPSASVAQVKKAYRKLSREKHPDKNPDNPEAVNEFIQITKAYTIMTDETARDNFLKYGNPDGKGSFAVGIALPNILQKKEYQIQVLMIFFIVTIIIIPCYFINKIQESQKDVGGVDVENRRSFAESINENMLGKHMPVFISKTSEMRCLKVKSKEEFDALNRIKQTDEAKEIIPKPPKGPDGKPVPGAVHVKSISLIVGYMYDLFDANEKKIQGIKEDLEIILKTMPSYIDILLQVTMEMSQMFKRGMQPKRITAKNIITIIQFSKNFMQGGWKNKDPYAQLPYFDVEYCKKLKQKWNKTLYQYCRLSKEERVALASSVFGKEPQHMKMIAEQEQAIECLPIVKLTMEAAVENEDEIVVGDILTCKLKVEYLNLKQGEKSGYVCSKYYPYLKRDSWYLIITDDSFVNLAAVEKINVTDRIYEKTFQERIQRPGPISFTAVLSNDSYNGLDQIAKVEVNVKAEPENRTAYKYSQYDLKAVDQANILEQALYNNDEEDEDTDEDELDEMAELKKKLKKVHGEDEEPESKKDK